MSKEPKVVVEGPGMHHHPIRPKDFNLASVGTLSSTFGKSEVEQTARNLIRFCQRRGGWYPFTVEELIDFYKQVGEDPRFIFFGLLGVWGDDGMFAQHTNPWHESPPYLVIGADGMYRVTERFIQQCAINLPKVPKTMS
ncbi:MAG: hypothetical protein UY64_C0022G0015 [Parcubacteria group bacterium GW2011_GWA1_51_12]|nr:MAG: hypothetical protein UY64_C0022G0015 [Parcubacteria group bacterium GW2011_GWA1_51_12]